MRSVAHDDVIDHLEQSGYDTEWVSEYDADSVERLGDHLTDDASRASVLDWCEVEGQVYDGLFEDPTTGPEWDFTHFVLSHDELVGRMMYYMVSVYGTDYDFKSLVDDLENLSHQYDAPFDREQALAANPE